MKYKTRSGFVLTNICGAQLLIPTRAAAEFCPSVLKLNAFECTIWETIEKGLPMENAFRIFKIFQQKKSDDEIKKLMDDVIKRFIDKGVMIACEDEEQ